MRRSPGLFAASTPSGVVRVADNPTPARPHVNRAPLEDIYARTLDDWEHRLFGTRSHVDALEWRRARVRWSIMEGYRLAAMIQRPQSLMIIGSVV